MSLYRLEKFRQLVFEGIKKSLAFDSEHKHYEGAINHTVEYPNYFEQESQCVHILELHCYVLGPSRHYLWRSDSLDNCLIAAEKDVNAWILDLERREIEDE